MPVAGTFTRTFKTPQEAFDYYNTPGGGSNTPAYGPVTGFGNQPTGFTAGTPAAMPTPGTLPGTPPQGGSGPYGAVPTVPDPTKSMADYIGGWQQNLPAYTQLLKSINDAANAQAKSNLETNLPGYGANLAQQSANISDLLAGKISPSTINNMATAAAERGITVGGGPNANAAYLRALGLTTEGLQAQGAQQFAQQIASTPVGKSIDWATFTSLANEQQQWEYLASVLRASPDPAAAGALNMLMAQMGQRAGYGGATGGNPSVGANQAANSNALFNMYRNLWGGSSGGGTNPVDSIISKYMPSAGPTAPATDVTGSGGVPAPNAYAPTYDPNINPSFDPFAQPTVEMPSLPYADEFNNGWTPDVGNEWAYDWTTEMPEYWY